HCGKALTRRTTHDYINIFDTQKFCEFRRWKFRQIFMQRLRDMREIFLKNQSRLLVEINCRNPSETRPFHAETETSTTAKKVYNSLLQWVSIHSNAADGARVYASSITRSTCKWQRGLGNFHVRSHCVAAAVCLGDKTAFRIALDSI
ncbi:MAG: hypothetical protein JWM99_4699, partial [Verrucomicrobiales bacterium]|nr:hypothetical protein [Verrucomicrobiales bacterium]